MSSRSPRLDLYRISNRETTSESDTIYVRELDPGSAGIWLDDDTRTCVSDDPSTWEDDTSTIWDDTDLTPSSESDIEWSSKPSFDFYYYQRTPSPDIDRNRGGAPRLDWDYTHAAPLKLSAVNDRDDIHGNLPVSMPKTRSIGLIAAHLQAAVAKLAPLADIPLWTLDERLIIHFRMTWVLKGIREMIYDLEEYVNKNGDDCDEEKEDLARMLCSTDEAANLLGIDLEAEKRGMNGRARL